MADDPENCAYRRAGALSVVMTERIIGYPHEKGIDDEGDTCPACPLGAGRDRWTGKRLNG